MKAHANVNLPNKVILIDPRVSEGGREGREAGGGRGREGGGGGGGEGRGGGGGREGVRGAANVKK